MANKDSFFSVRNLSSLAIIVVVVFAFRWSIFSPYHVPTASMEPTIKVGDRLLAWKLAYEFKFPFTNWSVLAWSTPARGDIVVFPCPRDPGNDCVKRVIGVEGDRIKIVNDVLFINSEEQGRISGEKNRAILEDIHDAKDYKKLLIENLAGREHWVMQETRSWLKPPIENWPVDGEEEFTVPKSAVFMMGDNRDNSVDSRFWGPVPLSMIKGRALFVLWSWYFPLKPNSTESSWVPVVRFYRFGHSLASNDG